MSDARQLLSHRPSNAKTIFLFCSCCNWGISLRATSGGIPTQEEVDQAFSAHRCEDYSEAPITS